jgi:hypothetical protein
MRSDTATRGLHMPLQRRKLGATKAHRSASPCPQLQLGRMRCLACVVQGWTQVVARWLSFPPLQACRLRSSVQRVYAPGVGLERRFEMERSASDYL